MLFIIFNALMVACLAVSIYHGWRYWENKQDNQISAFVSGVCLSLFAFYIIVLGVKAVSSALLEGFMLSVNALKALFVYL